MLALLQTGHDRVQRHALLGLQFRDAVTGQVVDEGLQVALQDRWRPQRVQALAANRSGIFALHAMPGLHGFAAPAPAAPWSPAEPARFELQVRDTRGRYLPACLLPELPSTGLWAPAGAWTSPPEASPPGAIPATPSVPLYSATTRPLPPAMASLRVELRRAGQPARPAPWARLELWLGAARIAEGLADDAGRALLVFALPRPREAALGTSPAGRPPAFEWTVTLRGFWNPAFAATDAPAVPDFDAVFSQPEAGLLRSVVPALPLPPLSLSAGETLMAHQPPESCVYVAE